MRRRAIEACWRDVAEKAKKNRTVFAQRRLKPEDVLPMEKMPRGAQQTRDVALTGRALERLGGRLSRSAG